MSQCRCIILENGTKIGFPGICHHEPNKLLTNWRTNPGSSWVDVGSVDDREPRQLPVDNQFVSPAAAKEQAEEKH